jgi:hypothetical protein
VIALFAALFFWLTSPCAQTTAALIVAAVALVLGFMALLPIAVRHSAPSPRAQSAAVRVAVGADRAGACAEATAVVRAPLGGPARNDRARRVVRQKIVTRSPADHTEIEPSARDNRLRTRTSAMMANRMALPFDQSASGVFNHLGANFDPLAYRRPEGDRTLTGGGRKAERLTLLAPSGMAANPW